MNTMPRLGPKMLSMEANCKSQKINLSILDIKIQKVQLSDRSMGCSTTNKSTLLAFAFLYNLLLYLLPTHSFQWRKFQML